MAADAPACPALSRNLTRKFLLSLLVAIGRRDVSVAKNVSACKQRTETSGMRTSRLAERNTRERIVEFKVFLKSPVAPKTYVHVDDLRLEEISVRVNVSVFKDLRKCRKGIKDLGTKMRLKIRARGIEMRLKIRARNRKLAQLSHELELRQTRATNCAGH